MPRQVHLMMTCRQPTKLRAHSFTMYRLARRALRAITPNARALAPQLPRATHLRSAPSIATSKLSPPAWCLIRENASAQTIRRRLMTFITGRRMINTYRTFKYRFESMLGNLDNLLPQPLTSWVISRKEPVGLPRCTPDHRSHHQHSHFSHRTPNMAGSQGRGTCSHSTNSRSRTHGSILA